MQEQEHENDSPSPSGMGIFRFGRRVVALGFIVLILLGNLWFVQKFLGQSVGDRFFIAWYISVFMVIVGGLILLAGRLWIAHQRRAHRRQ